MAALNFPPSPALNDIFTSGDRSWIFNGTAWQLRPRTTDNIAEGTTNLYYTDARVAAAPAVTALQTDLATEVSTRTTEIARIDTRVDSVLSNIDPVALDSLTEVVTAFQNADGSISDALAALSTAATSALGVETAARIAGDSDQASRLDTEISDRTSEVQSVRDALATEVSDRQSDVQSVRDITDGLGTMSTQNANAVNITGGRITGVTVNAHSMEVGTGATADLFVGNDGKVGIGTEAPTEKLTVNGNIDMLGGQVKTLGTPVADTDAATKGYVDTAVSGVQSALDTEISDRSSEVSRLDGRIDFEANRLDTEISDRAAAVSAEETRALAAEAVLEDTKQIKLVVSETAPAHVDGREWLDTTDFRRYISISSAWVESITA